MGVLCTPLEQNSGGILNITVNKLSSVNGVNKISKANKIGMDSTRNEAERIQNNQLLDSNYGRLLVKKSNVSFSGAIPVFSTLAKRINGSLPYLRTKEVIIVGKELNESLALLKESLGTFKGGIRKLYFIDDPNAEGVFALHKNGRGVQKIVNLSEKNLQVDTINGKSYFLKKAENIQLKTGDKVLTQDEPAEIFMPMEVLKPTYKPGYDSTLYTNAQEVERKIYTIENQNYKPGYLSSMYKKQSEVGEKTVNEPGVYNKPGYTSELYRKAEPQAKETGLAEKSNYKIGYNSELYKKKVAEEGNFEPEKAPATHKKPLFKVGYKSEIYTGKEPEQKAPTPAMPKPRFKVGFKPNDQKTEIVPETNPFSDLSAPKPRNKIGYTSEIYKK